MIAQITTPRHYSRNQAIIKAGERGHVFFLLIAGAVRVSVEGHRDKAITLGVLYPNDFFGEMGLLDGLPRSASVTAIEESQVLIISRKDVLNTSRRSPKVPAHGDPYD
jgi:CRP-like cAMP-binding protein